MPKTTRRRKDEAGYVRHVGQIKYAAITRKPEEVIFSTLHDLGISAVLYGALSRGLLTASKPSGKSDTAATSLASPQPAA